MSVDRARRVYAEGCAELAKAVTDGEVSVSAASVLALQEQCVPRTLNYELPDSQCPVNVVHGRSMKIDNPTALVLNHTVFGQATAMLLGAAR